MKKHQETTAPVDEIVENSTSTSSDKSSDENVNDKKSSKKSSKDQSKEKFEELEATIEQKNDQFLRLQAEFDNFRKRTLKEKIDLIKTAGESILTNLLPVKDDFERALQVIDKAEDIEAVKQGIELIVKKFDDFLKQNGIKEIDTATAIFDTDLHEAITKIPAPTDELKGKIVDVVQKGYTLNEKVIRYSKVVIGE